MSLTIQSVVGSFHVILYVIFYCFSKFTYSEMHKCIALCYLFFVFYNRYFYSFFQTVPLEVQVIKKLYSVKISLLLCFLYFWSPFTSPD